MDAGRQGNAPLGQEVHVCARTELHISAGKAGRPFAIEVVASPAGARCPKPGGPGDAQGLDPTEPGLAVHVDHGEAGRVEVQRPVRLATYGEYAVNILGGFDRPQ